MNIIDNFEVLCTTTGVPFKRELSVASYDTTTLFCPAGMQQYKDDFLDLSISKVTKANIQPCIRLTDLDLVGDGTHAVVFNMIGLFSFRDWSLPFTVNFFHEFVRMSGLVLDHVTVHPDVYTDWEYGVHPPGTTIISDKECHWSDGNIGGYCTEFYVKNKHGVMVEIGNIVNTLGDCIDVGFGLERMSTIAHDLPALTKCQELALAATVIINTGVVPANTKHGYILRKILRKLDSEGGTLDHPMFVEEQAKRAKAIEKYYRLKPRHKDKPPAWWWDTHGVDTTTLW